MSDTAEVGAEFDPVREALAYRDHLKAELARVDEFLAVAEELSCPRKQAEFAFWLGDGTDAHATLH